MGNTCYLNAALQVLCGLEEFARAAGGEPLADGGSTMGPYTAPCAGWWRRRASHERAKTRAGGGGGGVDDARALVPPRCREVPPRFSPRRR